MSNAFEALVKQILPYAKFKLSQAVLPAQSAAVLATQFIELGAVAQDDAWCPVSKERALEDFGDLNEEGAYYLQITLDEDLYQFCIDGKGTAISYV